MKGEGRRKNSKYVTLPKKKKVKKYEILKQQVTQRVNSSSKPLKRWGESHMRIQMNNINNNSQTS